MKKRLLIILIVVSIINVKRLRAQTYYINTIAGNSTAGYNGDGIAASSAMLNYPASIAIDDTGNLYISDDDNFRIRKIDTNGIIFTIAGTGIAGSSGDGGPATSAKIDSAQFIALDDSNNLYVTGHNCIRKINRAGIISKIIGTGETGYFGDGGLAAAAELNDPRGVAVDDSGNIYIADFYNNRIRIVSTNGIINTFAGNGTGGHTGDGGYATAAELYGPEGVGTDTLGNIYISDDGNSCLRMVNKNGIISTVPGTTSVFSYPAQIATDDSGNVFFAQWGLNYIVKINKTGVVTIAGNGNPGFSGDGGPATSAEIYQPIGVAVDKAGDVYISDTYNYRIRKLTTETTTAVNQLSVNNNQLSIYPNPTSGVINIISSTNMDDIKVTNLLGQTMLKSPLGDLGVKQTLDVRQLLDGMYFVTITAGNQSEIEKVVISK